MILHHLLLFNLNTFYNTNYYFSIRKHHFSNLNSEHSFFHLFLLPNSLFFINFTTSYF